MAALPSPEHDAPTLSWSVGKRKNSVTWPTISNKSWSEFVSWLRPDEPRDEREVDPYVGATLKQGRRSANTIEQRFLLTLDADYADHDFSLEAALFLVGHPYLIHSTWRHTEDKPRYRLIVPLDRGVSPNEYKELAWAIMGELGGDQFDKTTVQAERFMWGPSTQDPSIYFHEVSPVTGPYLHVDAWLRDAYKRTGASTATGKGAGKPRTKATGSGAVRVAEPTIEEKERAEEILQSAVDSVRYLRDRDEFEGRNQAVFHLLPLLLQFADAGALDHDEVIEALWDASQEVPADEPYTRQEFDRSVESARQYADENGPELPDTTPTKLAEKDFADVEEDIDLWTATEQLAHIAQAADAVGRNRLAMLSVVLIRILAEVDPGVYLPGARDGAVGGRAALNLGVALVGSSGQGKTTFASESEALLGIDQKAITHKPATGQGLIQTYLQWDKDLEKNVLKDDPRGFFIIDEVDTLASHKGDATNTLFSELRTMLTGGTTGSAAATKERNRILHGLTYNFQALVGVQPSRSGVLLSDRDAGTPQRFIWANVTDPRTAVHPDDRPPWPGPLNWNSAFLLGFEVFEPMVDYPEWAKKELRDYDYKVSLEGIEGGAVSQHAHQNLIKLKVAAAMAFLHESSVIEDLHLEFAERIIKASKRVQRECERILARAEFEARKSRVQVDERVAEVVYEEKLDALVVHAKEKLSRADGEWLSWRDIRPAHRDRGEWSEPLWEALGSDKNVETNEETRGSLLVRKARWVNGE